MVEQARVVIIGGGVVGCSIAYHLTEAGWTDIVLVEKGELTGGSTFHSAGLVGQLRSSVSLTRMMMYSVELYAKLERETGQNPSWHQVGSLRLASTPERLEELRRQASWAKTFGLPLDLISAREALDLFPLMDTTGVEGAVHLPTDGHIDPASLTMALARGAKSRGAAFQTGTRVERVLAEGGRVRGVVTDLGTIRCEYVVNAAGIWASEIGRMAGVTVPVIAMAHQYLVTAALPESGAPRDIPTMRDPDRLVYFRSEVDGLVMGGYERDPAPWGLDGIPPDFTHRLLAPDWDRFQPLLENAVERVPILGEAEITKLINGPEAFTPDGEFILGESPEVRGFFVAAGFCAHGIAGAGGVGKMMAEWIVEGEPSLDLWSMDLRRFGGHHASRPYVLSRVMEIYGTYYDIHYPNQERTAARPLRLSPIYPRLQELEASFGEKAGWERPNWFGSNGGAHGGGAPAYQPKGWASRFWSSAIGAEHVATRERAGLFDETSFSKIEVEGPGALAFLQRITDNQMDKLVGSVTYTQMLNKNGGVECDLTVTRRAEDRFLLITGTAFGPHDLGWMRKHLPADGSVYLRDITSSLACVGLWGPKARDLLQRTTDADLTNAGFPYLTAREITVAKAPVLAVRVTYVGELGWELYTPAEYGLELWDTLWQSGRTDELVAAGYRAIDSLRLEKGYRYWSADVTPQYTPYEAGLGFCVKLDKGEFIGRAALARARERGLSQRLCCLTLAEPELVALGGEPILNGGEVVGRVTSGGYGYTVARSIAYGYLPTELAKPGTALAIEVFGSRVAATVEREPLLDPTNTRIKC